MKDYKLNLFGKEVTLTKKQLTFGLFILVGLVFGFLALKRKSSTSSPTGLATDGVLLPGTGSVGGGGQGGTDYPSDGNTGTGGGGIIDSARNGINIALDYMFDTSNEFAAEGKTLKSSQTGGGFSLGGLGASLGFSQSYNRLDEKSAQVLETARDIFDNRTVAEGINDAQLDKVLGFFRDVGGTYDQRTANQAARQESARANARKIIGTNVVTQGEVKTTTTSVINDRVAKQVATQRIG